MSVALPAVRFLVLTQEVEETLECRVFVMTQPARVVRHQAWPVTIRHLAVDDAWVPGTGICFVQQRDVRLDADEAEGKITTDVELVNRGDVA